MYNMKKNFVKAMTVISVAIVIVMFIFVNVSCKNSENFAKENTNTSDSYFIVIVYNYDNKTEEHNVKYSLLSIIIQIVIKCFLNGIKQFFVSNDKVSKKCTMILRLKNHFIIMIFTISNSISLYVYIIDINRE